MTPLIDRQTNRLIIRFEKCLKWVEMKVGKKGSMKIGGLKVIPFFLFLIGYMPISGQDFKEVAASLGVNHYAVHQNRICAGVALFDFNNDGNLDFYATGAEASDHLYLNTGTEFVDVTAASGIAKGDVITCGVTSGDYDNDGFVDLFITTEQGFNNILLRNNGDSTFSDVSELSGIASGDSVWSTSATFVDINVDGYLDIYVGNYISYTAVPYYNNITTGVIPVRDNYLYINQKNGTFIESAAILGVDKSRAALAVTAADLNGDYLPDLFDGNDFGQAYGGNAVYLNDVSVSDSLFEAGKELNLRDPINCMGVSVGDANGDLLPDVHFTDWSFDRLKYGSEDCEPFRIQRDKINGLCWGTSFSDFNNDTHLDIITAYGTIIDLKKDVPGLLWNNGDGSFVNRTEESNISQEILGRGIATGDIDNDGDMDFIVAPVNSNENEVDKLMIYRNDDENDHNWSKVYLKGLSANADGYDATVYFYLEEKVMMRYMDGGSSFLSQNEAVIHAGLGDKTVIDSVKIVWPGGKEQMVYDLKPNMTYTIEEAEGMVSSIGLDYTCLIEGFLINSLSPVESLVKYYPNPFKTKLNVEVSKPSILKVYNMNGKFIWEESLKVSSVIDASKWETGILIMELISESQTERYKLIKR